VSNIAVFDTNIACFNHVSYICTQARPPKVVLSSHSAFMYTLVPIYCIIPGNNTA